MAQLLDFILADEEVTALVGRKYGERGLAELATAAGVALPTNDKPKATKAAKTNKASKQTSKRTQPSKASAEDYKVGTKFVHKGRDGDKTLTVVDGPEGPLFRDEKGVDHPSLTAAAKAATGAASINGKKYWTQSS